MAMVRNVKINHYHIVQEKVAIAIASQEIASTIPVQWGSVKLVLIFEVPLFAHSTKVSVQSVKVLKCVKMRMSECVKE